MDHKIVFVIGHKYYRDFNYSPGLLQYYLDNIQRFYPGAFTIIVDNNSNNLEEDILPTYKNYPNLIFLINNTECKFELGAYKVGIQFIIDNNFYNLEYCVFTQDTFILKNYFDFDKLKNNNIFACQLLSQHNSTDKNNQELFESILKSINMYNFLDEITFCCCNSFILHGSKIKDFLEITKNIIIKDKYGSNCTERFLARILYELNNHKVDYINDLNDMLKKYDFFSESSPFSKLDDDVYFCKFISFHKRHRDTGKYDFNSIKDLNY